MNRLSEREAIRKIAVLRATNIGDFLASLPALGALRETYPNAEIVYLGRPLHQAILANRPTPVDRVVIVPVSHGVRYEQYLPHLKEDADELDTFFREMQAEQFDLAIQMHGGGKNSNPFLKRLGAAFTVGMKTPDAIPLDRWMPYIFFQNEFYRLVELMQLLDIHVTEMEPHIPVMEDDHAEVCRVFPELREPYVVLHPGASDMRRRWLPERFAQVGDALAEAGYQVIVTGIEPERRDVEQVIGGMRYPALDACDRLTLGGLIGLLDGAALVVSNDTGTMHLANAVNTPNVGIFWCLNYLNWTHYGRTLHRPLVSWTSHSPLCGEAITRLDASKEFCQHETCHVAGVTVEQVLEAAFDLLDYAKYRAEIEYDAGSVLLR